MQQQAAAPALGLLDQVQVGLIGIYVAFAGIFWFGNISPSLLSNAKLVVFGILVLLGMALHRPFTRAMVFALSWLAVCALFAFFTTLANADVAESIDAARSFAEPALWLVALTGVRPAAYDALFKTLGVTLTLFFVVALYPFAAAVGLAPVTYPPASFVTQVDVRNLDAFQESISVVAGGFNGLRTGWGVSVALSALLAVSIYTRNPPASGWRVILSIIVIIGSMASIVVTGARGGSGTLLLIGIYGLLYRFRLAAGHRVTIIFVMVIAALAVSIVDYTVLIPENFFRGFGGGRGAFDIVNSATTGRLDTWIGAINTWVTSPFFGVGPEDSQLYIEGELLRPHNVWLRLLAESGLLLIVPVVVVSAQIVRLAFSRPARGFLIGQHATMWPDTSPVLLCGLAIAMIEPSVIFGSMNTNIVFWTALWAMMAQPGEARPAVRVADRPAIPRYRTPAATESPA